LRQRVPLIISCAALAAAVLGATSPGQAAVRGLESSVPFAKTSGYAASAGNAAKLNGRVSSTSGKAGTIPVVGTNGKLPASLVTGGTSGAAGAVGPAGPAGPAGPTGPAGISGYQIVSVVQTVSAAGNGVANCPTGKKVLGGGASILSLNSNAAPTGHIENSNPSGDDSWGASWQLTSEPQTAVYKVTIYAICANVST
jgi:hypothetical protein